MVQFDKRVKIFRSNNALKYIQLFMHTFYVDHGIIHQITCPHISQQYGVFSYSEDFRYYDPIYADTILVLMLPFLSPLPSFLSQVISSFSKFSLFQEPLLPIVPNCISSSSLDNPSLLSFQWQTGSSSKKKKKNRQVVALSDFYWGPTLWTVSASSSSFDYLLHW